MANYQLPSKLKNISISENSITLNNKTYSKKEIQSIEYKAPTNIALLFIGKLFVWWMGLIFIIGIPFYFYDVINSSKYWRCNVTLKTQFDKKGKNKKIPFFMTIEDVNNVKENY